jgi:hypothetical protein
MTEFETIKTALKRLEHEIVIAEWSFIDEAWIEDLTAKVTFEFKNGQLDFITNDKTD